MATLMVLAWQALEALIVSLVRLEKWKTTLIAMMELIQPPIPAALLPLESVLMITCIAWTAQEMTLYVPTIKNQQQLRLH